MTKQQVEFELRFRHAHAPGLNLCVYVGGWQKAGGGEASQAYVRGRSGILQRQGCNVTGPLSSSIRVRARGHQVGVPRVHMLDQSTEGMLNLEDFYSCKGVRLPFCAADGGAAWGIGSGIGNAALGEGQHGHCGLDPFTTLSSP